MSLPSREQALYAEKAAHLREALGEDVFTAACREGSALTVEQAADHALNFN